MKIGLSSESTIDFSKDLLKKYDIHSLPLYVYLGEQEFFDGKFECEKIFDFVKTTKKLPKTSAPNEADYIKHFKKLLKENDAVIHLSISSGVSSSYDHALSASKHFKNVFVIDTKSISTGIGLLAIRARNLINQGLNAEEIVEDIYSNISKVRVSLVISNLSYIYKGGRCNSILLLGSNLLKIRPQIVVREGVCRTGRKFIGSMDNVFIKYTNAVLQEYKNADLENVFITYTTCKQEVLDQIVNMLKQQGFKNINITKAGATVTCYTGENSLAVILIEK
ncbi:MAG: DegV family protein [Clostridia bacterium]|nr:DegV family protein [Clostridia bacterium]